MDRQRFPEGSVVAAAAGLGAGTAAGVCAGTYWGKLRLRSGPPVADRLNQDLFRNIRRCGDPQ